MAYITMYQGKGGAVDIWEEYTQNVTNNTSTLTIIAYVKKTNSSYYSYRQSPRTFTLTVNGVASTLGWTFDFRNMTLNQRYEIMRTSRTFTHNADGSKSAIPVSVYCETGTDGLGTVSGSTSVGVATIARASTPTLNVNTQALGSAITISTNRASSAFTHTITYNFGGLTGTIATGVATSYAWTLPSTLASKMANSSASGGTIYLYTYSGSTHIGTKTIAFTATVPSNATYNPTISISSVSIYGSGRDKTIEKYVQGISRVSVVSAPVARQSATIKSTTITVARSTNSMSYSGTSATSGVLTLSGTYTVTVSTVDSRGRSASASTTFISEAYAVPKINAFTARRTTGTTVTTVRSGTYTYMGGSNSLSVSVQRAVRGGSFTALENTAGTTNGTFGGTYNPTGNSETTSYDFKLVISDSFGKSAEAIVSVSTSSVALSIKGDVGIGVGKVWERGALDVGGDAFVTGVIQPRGGVMSPFGPVRPTTANLIPTGDATMKHLLATTSMTEGKPGDDGYIMHFEWDTTSGWSSQLQISNSKPSIKMRAMVQGNWGDWTDVVLENNPYAIPVSVSETAMTSLANEVQVQLPANVGSDEVWLVVIKANPNPGGSSVYRAYLAGILSAAGGYVGGKVVLSPMWSQLAAHQSTSPLTVTPYAVVSGSGYVATAAANQANTSPFGLIISGFSAGYPTIVSRQVSVTIKKLR